MNCLEFRLLNNVEFTIIGSASTSSLFVLILKIVINVYMLI